MDDFESRARRAGRLLIASVDSLEPGPPPGPRQRVRAPVVLAAIALVAVVVVGLYLRRDDHRVDTSDGAPFIVDAAGRYFEPTLLPEGLVLTARRDVQCATPAPGSTVPEGDDPPGSALLCRDEIWYLTYESPDSERFVSITRERRLSAPEPDADANAVPVRGRAGHLSHLTAGFIRLHWAEDDRTTLVINAAGLSADEVIGIAESLVPVASERWNAMTATTQPGPQLPPMGEESAADTAVLIRLTMPFGQVAELRETPDRRIVCLWLDHALRGCGGGDRLGFDTRPPWPRYAGGGGGAGLGGQWSYYKFDAPVGFPTEFSVRTIFGRTLPSGISADGRFILVVDPDMADRELLEAVDPDTGTVITRLYAAGRNRS